MSSHTIHVIGFSASVALDEHTTRRHECHAMNKMEMAQQKKIMKESGTPVVGWYAQTGTGRKMIGAPAIDVPVLDSVVRHLSLVGCPVCKGQGKKALAPGFVKSCVICNGSGITKQGHWEKWQPWQLEQIGKEFNC